MHTKTIRSSKYVWQDYRYQDWCTKSIVFLYTSNENLKTKWENNSISNNIKKE